jgi:hypothetical protein
VFDSTAVQQRQRRSDTVTRKSEITPITSLRHRVKAALACATPTPLAQLEARARAP